MWLAAILCFGILTLWVPARWALSSFQVALFALAVVRILQRRSVRLHFVGCLLGLAIAWGGLQVAAQWSVDRLSTLEAILNWTANLAAFALAADLYGNAEERERFLRCALIFTAFLAVVSIFTFLTQRCLSRCRNDGGGRGQIGSSRHDHRDEWRKLPKALRSPQSRKAGT